MSAPTIKVGRVRLDVFTVGQPMGVKYELVRTEEYRTVNALDALGARGVVSAGGYVSGRGGGGAM